MEATVADIQGTRRRKLADQVRAVTKQHGIPFRDEAVAFVRGLTELRNLIAHPSVATDDQAAAIAAAGLPADPSALDAQHSSALRRGYDEVSGVLLRVSIFAQVPPEQRAPTGATPATFAAPLRGSRFRR